MRAETLKNQRREESLLDYLTKQAEQTTDPHIKRQLLISISELVDHALDRFE